MGTSPTLRTVKDLVVAVINNEIQLPRFQRSITWGPEQREKLITSLINGFPVGSLLVYREPGSQSYLLIDGLQRLTTLIEYRKTPLKSLSLDAIIEPVDDFVAAVQALWECEAQVVQGALRAWLDNQGRITEEFDGTSLLADLSGRLGLELRGMTSIEAAARRLLTEIRKRVDLDDRVIPVLQYEGDKRTLPAVFQALNQGGVQLSHYDILNAVWTNERVVVDNKRIIAAIRERYAAVRDVGFQVVDVGGNFNLYEYLLGLGKHLLDRDVTSDVEYLLAKRRRSDRADELIFTLAGVAHGLRPGLLGELPTRFKRDSQGAIDPLPFEKALGEALKFVASVLSPYLSLRLKGSRGSVAHTDYQIASIIGRVLVGMFDPPDWTPRDTWPTEREVLRRALPRHYLIDILRKEWAGSGDSRLFNMVWQRSSDGKFTWPSAELSAHYMSEVSDEALRRALQTYFESSLTQQDTGRRSPSSIDRLLLQLSYRHHSTAAALSVPTEVEHLMPVSLLRALVSEDRERRGWPINSIGNLAVLDKKTNREKSRLTLAEYVRRRPDEADRLARYAFIDVKRIDLPYTTPHGKAFEEPYEGYLAFLRENFACMQESIIMALKN